MLQSQVSGRYTIVISLHGEQLPCSPALCFARTPTADAASCVLSGDALHSAVARVQQTFEIGFRDTEGRVAHAEELDVHVVRSAGRLPVPCQIACRRVRALTFEGESL